MTKTMLFILMTVIMLAISCSTSPPPTPYRRTEIGPIPKKPTHTISINIDSIPSGADVYTIEKDGQLGAKIGVTPLVKEVGIAKHYYVYTDTGEVSSNRYDFYTWGTGVRPVSTMGTQPDKWTLNIAFVKGNHSIAVASKELHSRLNQPLKNRTISLTVPLKTLEQVNQEYEFYLRKQEIANARNRNIQPSNQNQNITITQKKDELDSINSGLDALLKMSALGAFNR